ncbi:lipopolysaccharide biosynthesis protein [Vulcaniibacterium tengchongense]|uniref:O-antigen/teichoic acid export membrane protein n=1 Tax=Vulcaniibacterium tengchongense TaxID=1273429 RepID=A0A3N4VF50_9GAMM|nr:polysaccharide biosynthesis C-terminal domain-containing protein [Vulcaniibacterium tengchongense]RPE81656.1 O-antigen/teichoic acid export membrane protein [Vulcaniibacterium tengchongense]
MIPRAWRNAAAAIGLLWLATAAGAAMVFLAQMLLARRLGPPEYGLFASSLATVTMVAPLAGFGLSQFRLKAYGAEGWGADRWLRPSLRFTVLSTAAAFAIVLVWALRGGPVDAPTRAALLALSPVILGMLAIDLVGSKLRLEERYGALAGWQMLMPAGRLLVAVLVVLIPSAGVVSATLGYCAVALLAVALALPQLRAMLRGGMQLRGHGPRPADFAPAPNPGVMRLCAEAWAYGVAAVLYPVFFQVSTVLLKYLGGDAQAGRYGIALAVMTAIYLLPATVYQKFLLSKLHRWAVHEVDKFWRVYRRGNWAMLLSGLAVGLALAVAAPLLVPLAFGEAYRGVAAILMVLALCVPIRFLSTAVGSALLTSDHMRYRVLAMAAATAAAVGLNLLLIPFYAELGAAAATVLAELLLLLAMYLGVRRIPRPEATA